MAWDWAGETRQTWGTSVAKWSGRYDDIGHKLEQLLGHQDVLLQRLHCIEDQGAKINEKLDEVLRQQGLLKQRLDAVEDARQQHGANLAPEAASNMNEGARSIMALDPQIARLKQIARLSSIGLATALPSPAAVGTPPPKELVKTATPSAPLWSACRKIVPYENLMLAEQCFGHGWHRVGEEFMDCSLENFRDSEHNWTASLHSRGMARIYDAFSGAFARHGASWCFYREGQTYFTATVCCRHCLACHKVIINNRVVDDKEEMKLAEFLMIEDAPSMAFSRASTKY